MSSEVIAVIPARGGSKTIPQKNIKPFYGKPLLVWSIEQALASELVSSVWVSTDCSDISRIAKENGANIIERPQAISGDLASSESAWIHALEILKKK